MTINTSKEVVKDLCNLKVKLKAGASVVKVKPLFSLDLKSLIVASGADVKVFNIQSGECTQTLSHHHGFIVSLQHSMENQLQIFSCFNDGIVVRWDFNEGEVLQVYDMKFKVSAFFVHPATECWFVTRKRKGTFQLYSLIYKKEKIEDVQVLLNNVLPKENSVAFDSKGKYLASVIENNLSICEIKTRFNVKHKAGECTLTCVAFHPSELVLATGDNKGRAIVWSDILNRKRPIKTIYHWHTLPLADLVFSTEGSYLFTGGGEAALVKWNLFSNVRYVLPRLGAPICYVSISCDNSHVVTAHESNALKIINSQRVVVQVIQGLTQGYFQGTKAQNTLPTGMLYDSRTKALVMNGRPGHLQFYNIHEEKQLFNLDITSRNFISQERDAVILNIDVQKAAFDDKGCWLATSEYWYDEETSPQIWLKFWKFDSRKQNFVLNTNIILPHNKEINCITFQHKSSDSCSASLAVTTSSDCKFKIWSLEEDDDHKQSWTCNAMGCYRDLPAKDACFSEEGSVLAIAFGGAATLWKVDNITLKAVLCNDKTKQDIVQLMFGKKTCSHFLICHDGSAITVWNVLSLTIVWVVHTEVQFLVQDSTSDIVAAFFHNQNLIIFRPTSPQPIYSAKRVCEKPVIAAVFIPNVSSKEDKSSCFHKNAKLFFMDEERHLFTLTDEKDLDVKFENKMTISQRVPMTPFGMLKAEQTIYDVRIKKPEKLIIDSQDKLPVSEISCPTFQDPLALCSTILPSLLTPLQKSINEPEPTIMKSKKDEDSEIVKKVDKYDINSQDNKEIYTDFSFLEEAFILLAKKSVNL